MKLLLALAVALPQQAEPGDSAALGLIAGAAAVRNSNAADLESYEGVLHERVFAGVAGGRLRRERILYDSERIARVRWDRVDGRVIQWLGARDDSPALGFGNGVSWQGDPGDGEGGSLTIGAGGADEGARLNPLIFEFRPSDDRLLLGGRFFLHPLADSAADRYAFESGDTLRLRDSSGDLVVLAEVRLSPAVEPDFDLLSGSLWFDLNTGALTRAHLRPSRPYDLTIDGADDVPGLLRPFTVQLDYYSLDYSLHEGRWWLPRRLGLHAKASAGGVGEGRVHIEWVMRGYMVNDPRSEISDAVPEGWATWTDSTRIGEGEWERVRNLRPSRDSLRAYPGLTGETLASGTQEFSRSELAAILQDVSRVRPDLGSGGLRLRYGWEDGNLRYNRVEGLGLGISTALNIGRGLALIPRVRVGLAERNFRGEVGVGAERGGLEIEGGAFRRLNETDDFGEPLSLGSSIANFVLGNAVSEFYQATGIEAAIRRDSPRFRWNVRGFREHHQSVEAGTDFYLGDLFSAEGLPGVLPIDDGHIWGVSFEVGAQAGSSETRGVLFGKISGEAATGTFDYRRLLLSAEGSRTVFEGLSAAVAASGGRVWGDTPVQKDFFLGGARTLRGYPGSFRHGSAFWNARAEIAAGDPILRMSAFTDLGGAGRWDELGSTRALWSAGVGISLLEGIVRFDVATPLRSDGGIRVYLYFGGLF